MPKYKVGDIAALFPKPKEPTTEAGKKLESLFKEFHAVKTKVPHQNGGLQTATVKSESVKTKIENERLPKKNKKRKFSDSQTLQSFGEEQKAKKFKLEEPEIVKNVLSKKKNKILTEQGFPRSKKLSKTNKNKFTKSFRELEAEETKNVDDFNDSSPFSKGNNPEKSKKTRGFDDVKDSTLSNEVSKFLSEQGFSKNKKMKFGENDHDFEVEKHVSSDKQENTKNFKSKDKKQKAIFIKKSKKAELDTSNNDMKSRNNKNLSKRVAGFKSEILGKDLGKKSPKDLYKHSENGHKQISISPNAGLNHISENKDSGEHKEVNEVESTKSNSPTKNVGDFIRNKKFKKKVSYNSFVQKSEQQETYGEELDFIKIPGMKSEASGDELSRTLFVGNLPLDANRKALKQLFTPFGEIEKIRFHGKETDKAKIFSEKASKSLNEKNYAADSIPGYIVFKTKESATFALSLTGTLFQGHHITVDFALPSGSHKLYDDKRSIFIGNLPFDCKDDSIWEVFSECGRIESVRIVRDKNTGISKGFGFVQFSTVQAKENALNLKNLEIQERPVRVKEISSDKAVQTKAKNAPIVKRSNTFKSHAIRLKKKSKDTTSRKSVSKIMKKQKKLHEKKKISSILLKSMKK